MKPLASFISRLSEWSGRLISWLCIAMILLICYDVLMRYLFNITAVWFQEVEWHLFAMVFLIGAAYTHLHDGHVRVDVFFTRFSPRGQHWINLIGTVLFLLPFCLLMIKTSWNYASLSFRIGEGSPDPNGLPFRFLIKSAIPLGFTLLLLQGIAEIIQASLALFVSSDQTEPA